MANSYLGYQNPTEANTDKKLDSESLSVGGETVERERIQIAGAAAAEISDVSNDHPASGDYGLIVRNIPRPYSGGGQGRKAVAAAGTPEALGGDVPCKKVLITALQTNTDIIVIGFSNAVRAGTENDGANTRTGIPLFPNNSYELEIQNLNLIYLDAVVSGQGATYAYLT